MGAMDLCRHDVPEDIALYIAKQHMGHDFSNLKGEANVKLDSISSHLGDIIDMLEIGEPDMALRRLKRVLSIAKEKH